MLCRANLSRADLPGANLSRADLSGAKLQNADLWRANLAFADLSGANLAHAYLSGADLSNADLSRADLSHADLLEADLRGADVSGADLHDARLSGANLRGANLSNGNLSNANLENAKLSEAILTNAVYAPRSPPPDGAYIEGLVGLETVTFPPGHQSGLVRLRELLQQAGLRTLERQATFAIERNRALHDREDEDIGRQVGGWLKLIAFEWTTAWGMHPERALLIMLGLLAMMGIWVYPVTIAASPNVASNEHGIFKVWTGDAVGARTGRICDADQLEIRRLTSDVPWVFLWGLWFSTLSAFHIGWRDLNVGNWLSRLQPTPFALRPRGWVRVAAGVQSLLSVYLIAMWALTNFGRPFQ